MNEEPIVLRCEVQLDPEGVEALARRLAELWGRRSPSPTRAADVGRRGRGVVGRGAALDL